jgi:hypothetical protein
MHEFVTAILEKPGTLVDVAQALNMTVSGIVGPSIRVEGRRIAEDSAIQKCWSNQRLADKLHLALTARRTKRSNRKKFGT